MTITDEFSSIPSKQVRYQMRLNAKGLCRQGCGRKLFKSGLCRKCLKKARTTALDRYYSKCLI